MGREEYYLRNNVHLKEQIDESKKQWYQENKVDLDGFSKENLWDEIKDERARKEALEKTNSQLLWIIMGMFVFIMYLFVSLG